MYNPLLICRSESDEDPSSPYFEEQAETAVLEKPELEEPPLYQVLLHNDDYTPMEFVVEVLERFFNLRRELATSIMLDVHTKGKAVCGQYAHDIAETKVTQVMQLANDQQHPLLCTMEPVS